MQVIQDVLCPVCGCLCDDIEVTVDNNKITKVQKACAMGAMKFLNFTKERNLTPMVKKNGKLEPVTLDEAIDRAAEILVNAKFPILYGWSLSSCEATKKGIELAEEVGAVIDNQTTVCHGPGVQGMHDIGESTCTLGEVKHRADLIVYWGCNPEDAHPRHLERYSIESEGKFRKDRKERRMIVVDVRKTTTAAKADKFIKVDFGGDYELLSALRMAVHMEEMEQERVSGISVEEIEALAEEMRSCQFGVIFYGQGVTQTQGKDRNIDALFSLVRDLNKYTKFTIMPIRGHFNVTGANEVLTWQTGFPYAVDLSRGYPWYNPGDTSIVDIMRREENDATLIVGSDPVSHLPPRAVRHMLKHPVVVIDPHNSLTAFDADVVIPCAFAGLEVGGTAYRMDGVALPLKKVVEPPDGVLPDEEIVQKILERARSIKRTAEHGATN